MSATTSLSILAYPSSHNSAEQYLTTVDLTTSDPWKGELTVSEPGIWHFTFDGVAKIENEAYGQATIALEVVNGNINGTEPIVKARSYVGPGMQFNRHFFISETGPSHVRSFSTNQNL